MTTVPPGLLARRVETPRLGISILERDGDDPSAEPVLLVHGNVSSALFYTDLMLALPRSVRPIAVDLRGFGDTDPEPIDATRGVRDHVDDLLGLFDALDLPTVHLFGWSMGGGVVLQLLRDAPRRVRSLILQNPVSPYGYGGTHGPDGALNSPDGAGSGGGCANPDFVTALATGDRGTDSPVSPRTVLDSLYVAPGAPALPDLLVESMLSTRTGPDHYPGNAVPSPHWPGTAPGTTGVLNSLAPTRFRIDDLPSISPMPPILWLRGDADQIVSDTAALDLAQLGALGVVPGWPGADVCPPQPMVTQTRTVLDAYAAAGGSYREHVLPGVGHSPHLERPAEVLSVLVTHLGAAS